MEATLIRVTSNGEKTPVPLTHERVVIGRLDDCQIRIPAPDVSRNHCEIVIEDGSIEIRDLGSSNGTFVNQERISSRPLSAGDLISVGGVVFVLSINGEPGEIDAEMMYEDGLPEPVVASHPGPVSPAPSKVPASSFNDDSSMMDFEFDFDDDDDQPPL